MIKRFKNNVISKKIAQAVVDADLMLHPGSSMMQDISSKNDFRFNTGTGVDVYTKIIACNIVAPVFTYRPKWPWSSALGYSDKKGIHLNVYKIEVMTHAETVGLLCHEYLHQVGFGHGNNFKTEEKVKYSVNYFASEGISNGKWV